MATEKQIREAVKTAIEAAAPLAKVVSRNILDLASNKWLNFLRAPNDGKKLHGYFVTWDGGESEPPYLRDYTATISIFGAYEYRTGDDSSNSEDTWNAEVEDVIERFINPTTQPAELSGLTGWSARLYVSDEPGSNTHIAEIRLSVSTTLGC